MSAKTAPVPSPLVATKSGLEAAEVGVRSHPGNRMTLEEVRPIGDVILVRYLLTRFGGRDRPGPCCPRCHHRAGHVRQLDAIRRGVREFVRLVIGQWGMDDFVPCLVASELVTNALRYASERDGDVTLRLDRTEDDMASEVGQGLFIVDQFCRRWGLRPLAGQVVFAITELS